MRYHNILYRDMKHISEKMLQNNLNSTKSTSEDLKCDIIQYIDPGNVPAWCNKVGCCHTGAVFNMFILAKHIQFISRSHGRQHEHSVLVSLSQEADSRMII